MNKEFWTDFYNKPHTLEPSPFCYWFLEQNYDGKTLVDLGCGNGRDLYALQSRYDAVGIDETASGKDILTTTIQEYIKTHKSPDIVYTRFVWHAIEEETQHMILDWCTGILAIEARTTFDKVHGHKRNLVDVKKLIKQLPNYSILHLGAGWGYAQYKDEDPHVVRLIAKRI